VTFIKDVQAPFPFISIVSILFTLRISFTYDYFFILFCWKYL